MGVLQKNWHYEIAGGIMFLIYQNTTMRVYGAWIRIYHVCAQKHMTPFDGLLWSPTGSRQAAKSARIYEIRLLRCTWTKLQLSVFKMWDGK